MLDRALHSETREPMVVYRQLYASPGYPEGSLWVRPEAMFAETVIVDSREAPRFRFLGEMP